MSRSVRKGVVENSMDLWKNKVDALRHKVEVDDLDFLDELEVSVRDEFMRLPYEEQAPRTSYQAAHELT